MHAMTHCLSRWSWFCLWTCETLLSFIFFLIFNCNFFMEEIRKTCTSKFLFHFVSSLFAIGAGSHNGNIFFSSSDYGV